MGARKIGKRVAASVEDRARKAAAKKLAVPKVDASDPLARTGAGWLSRIVHGAATDEGPVKVIVVGGQRFLLRQMAGENLALWTRLRVEGVRLRIEGENLIWATIRDGVADEVGERRSWTDPETGEEVEESFEDLRVRARAVVDRARASVKRSDLNPSHLREYEAIHVTLRAIASYLVHLATGASVEWAGSLSDRDQEFVIESQAELNHDDVAARLIDAEQEALSSLLAGGREVANVVEAIPVDVSCDFDLAADSDFIED